MWFVIVILVAVCTYLLTRAQQPSVAAPQPRAPERQRPAPAHEPAESEDFGISCAATMKVLASMPEDESKSFVILRYFYTRARAAHPGIATDNTRRSTFWLATALELGDDLMNTAAMAKAEGAELPEEVASFLAGVDECLTQDMKHMLVLTATALMGEDAPIPLKQKCGKELLDYLVEKKFPLGKGIGALVAMALAPDSFEAKAIVRAARA